MKKLKLTSEQKTALQESIDHWQRYADGEGITEGSPGPNSCACCELYIADLGCEGCPIAQYAEDCGCTNTPYGEAEHAYITYGPTSPEFLRAAKAELEYLQKILNNAI